MPFRNESPAITREDTESGSAARESQGCNLPQSPRARFRLGRWAPSRCQYAVFGAWRLQNWILTTQLTRRRLTPMRNSVARHILVSVIVCISSQSNAQQQSLIVSARANGCSARVTVDVDGPVGTIDTMVGPSSLIVRGLVRSATTKLSPDE